VRLLALLLALAGPARADWTPEFARLSEKIRAALDQGRTREARAEVARLDVPAQAPPADRVDMLLKRAEYKAALNDYPGTETDERAALSAEPLNFQALCAFTQFLRERGRLAESLAVAETLTKVVSGIPPRDRAEKWLQRAETLMRLGRYDESAADVGRALRDKPEDVPSLWLMAQVQLHAERPRAALPFADRMIAAARTPAETARAYAQRAQVREALGDAKGSEEDVARGLAAAPEDHLALEARVQRLRAQGRLAEARVMADRMVAAGRSAPPTRRALLYGQRAQVERMLGDATGAEADLRAALALEPDSVASLRTLSELLLDEGRPAEAAEAATRMLAAAAEAVPAIRAEAHVLRARAYAAAGRAGAAARDRGAARGLAPDSAASLREASQTALAANDFARALSYAERLVAVSSSASAGARAEARMNRGAVRLAAGRRADAERDFQEAARLDPDSLYAREQLAEIALGDARYAEAEERAQAFLAVAASTSSRTRAEALVLRARARSGRGLQEAAVEDLTAALAEDPSARDALAAMADSLARLAMTEKTQAYAQRLFASAAAAPAGDEAALKTMTAVVSALTRAGRADLALTDAGVLVEKSAPAPASRRAESLAARAAALEALSRDGDALADLTRAAVEAPAETEPRRRLALLLARMGRTPETRAAVDAVVAVSTAGTPAQAADILLWRADRRADIEDWAGAEADHAAAERALPGTHSRDAEAGARWAAAASARGGARAAWPLLEKLRAFPGAPAAARAALASAEAESRWSGGDAAGAKAAMDAALSADASAACAATLLGERSKAAPAWFDACVARLPGDAALRNDRGVARWTAGRRTDAVADFRAALAASPAFLPAALSLSSALEADGKSAEGAKVLAAALSAPGTDPTLVPDARAQLKRLKDR